MRALPLAGLSCQSHRIEQSMQHKREYGASGLRLVSRVCRSETVMS